MLQVWLCALTFLLAACSRSSDPAPTPEPPAASGHIVVALTIDWEGAYFSPEGLDAIEKLRTVFGAAPFTHFICASYFTTTNPDPTARRRLVQAVRPGDEVAVHLHAWASIATAAGIEPKLSPSFLTGTNKLLELEGPDVGFDVDLDAYSVSELRALLRTSRRVLELTKLPITRVFRAGGYLATPKVLQALEEEGYEVDSSATDYRQLDEKTNGVLPSRIKAIWPSIDINTQPFPIKPGGKLLEMPVAAFADFADAAKIVRAFDAAQARLRKDPTHDQFIVLGFDQETAADFAGRLGEAYRQVQQSPGAEHIEFMTIEQAAKAARAKR